MDQEAKRDCPAGIFRGSRLECINSTGYERLKDITFRTVMRDSPETYRSKLVRITKRQAGQTFPLPIIIKNHQGKHLSCLSPLLSPLFMCFAILNKILEMSIDHLSFSLPIFDLKNVLKN